VGDKVYKITKSDGSVTIMIWKKDLNKILFFLSLKKF
jgi:hypothetical protein